MPPRCHRPSTTPGTGLEPCTALADDTGAEIATFLEEYRRAMQAHDVTAVATLYVASSRNNGVPSSVVSPTHRVSV